MADTVGNLNPMRYRGYYFDNESGYYYLQSRYYDSNTCRFINADESSMLELTKGEAVGHNLFAYCYNNPVMNEDPTGLFVVRRWMISTFIDLILMEIPGIGAVFAPIKSIGKQYGKAALKSRIKTPLISFIKFIGKNASKMIKGFQNVVRKVPGVGKWLAKKIPVTKLVNIIAGSISSAAINKLLNVIQPNIDIFLSIGGAISGILDYWFDKKINNKIWVI